MPRAIPPSGALRSAGFSGRLDITDKAGAEFPGGGVMFWVFHECDENLVSTPYSSDYLGF